MKIEELIEIVKQELPETKDNLNGETRFRDLEEWDSLTGMAIVVLLEETYSVSIPDNVFRTFNTFSDMFEYIETNK